jgi:hypothetical protein
MILSDNCLLTSCKEERCFCGRGFESSIDITTGSRQQAQALIGAGPAGVIMGAAVLGVLINRATIPQARVVFSDNCLLTSRNGEPCLILRIGNTRGNFLLNPEIRIGFLTVWHACTAVVHACVHG